MPPKQQTLNVVDIAQLQATIIDLQQQIQRLQAGDEAKQQEQSTSIKYGIKEAKENVPKLDAKNKEESFRKFLEAINLLLTLMPNMEKVIKLIKPYSINDTTVLGDVCAINKDALEQCKSLSGSEIQLFYVFIITKIPEELSSIYKRIPKSETSGSKRLIILWSNILSKFSANSERDRQLANITWDQLCQNTEQTLSEFIDEVKEQADFINNLYSARKGTVYEDGKVLRIDDESIWAKIEGGMTPEYNEILRESMRAFGIRASGDELSLDAKIKIVESIIEQEERMRELREKDYQSSEARMARTTEQKSTSNSPWFRTTIHKDQAHKLVCHKFNGKPGSCAYGKNCRFKHIFNRKEREAALAANKAWRKQKKSNRNQDTSSDEASEGSTESDEEITSRRQKKGKTPKNSKYSKDKSKRLRKEFKAFLASRHSSAEEEFEEFSRSTGVRFTQSSDTQTHSKFAYVGSSTEGEETEDNEEQALAEKVTNQILNSNRIKNNIENLKKREQERQQRREKLNEKRKRRKTEKQERSDINEITTDEGTVDSEKENSSKRGSKNKNFWCNAIGLKKIFYFLMIFFAWSQNIFENIVKYVGFGYISNDTSPGSIYMNGRNISLCYMARKGIVKGLTIFDSGCSDHMSGDLSVFVGELKTLTRPKKIYGFDNGTQLATKTGTARVITIINGVPKARLLKNCLYVPQMGNLTLISQGKLDSKGYGIVTKSGITKVYSPKGKVFLQASRSEGLYKLNPGTTKEGEHAYLTKNEAHRLFGHINEADLNKMGDFEGNLDS